MHVPLLRSVSESVELTWNFLFFPLYLSELLSSLLLLLLLLLLVELLLLPLLLGGICGTYCKLSSRLARSPYVFGLFAPSSCIFRYNLAPSFGRLCRVLR